VRAVLAAKGLAFGIWQCGVGLTAAGEWDLESAALAEWDLESAALASGYGDPTCHAYRGLGFPPVMHSENRGSRLSQTEKAGRPRRNKSSDRTPMCALRLLC
jgi:hypothetical protein